MARAELVRLTGVTSPDGPPCGGEDCPNLHRRAETQSIIVQGHRSEGFTVPEDEALVEIPESVLREAVRALGW